MRRCRIESLGVSPPRRGILRWGSVRHAVEAGRRCLAASHHNPSDIRVLVNSGVHRDGHTCEPAMACYVQHRLGINVEFQGRRTVAFDLQGGGTGVLTAAHVVAALMQAGEVEVGLIVASEANGDRRPDPGYTYPASGAAMLVDLAPRSGVGFGAFSFDTRAELGGLHTSTVTLTEKRGRVRIHRDPGVEDAFLQGAAVVVEDVLAQDGLSRADVDLVVPAQVSGDFLARLGEAIGFPNGKILDLGGVLPDTLSTSVLLTLHQALDSGRLGPGKVAVLLACGSGVTVGAATYHF